MWKKRLLRYLLPTLAFILACGLQTTVWPSAWIASPPLWLLVLVWLSLYRPEPSTVLFLYALGFLATSFTAMPLKMMLFTILILHSVSALMRDRLFRPGLAYFVMASLGWVALYNVIFMALSHALERVPTPPLILERAEQLVFTIPAAIAVYTVMNVLERPFLSDLVDAEGAP